MRATEPLIRGVAPADGRTVLPALVPASGCCSHTHVWSKTPLMNWSLPLDTQVPSFPATKTKLRSAGIITVSAPPLPCKSCFQREERGLKQLAQHSVAIFGFPPLSCRWGKRKQHETSPFLGLPKTLSLLGKGSLSGSLQTTLCYQSSWAQRHVTGHILSTWLINKQTPPVTDSLFDSTQGCRAPLRARSVSWAGAGSFEKIKEKLACLLRAK